MRFALLLLMLICSPAMGANELRALVAASSSGNYAIIRNPDNPAQAWDTDAGDWATYNRTDSDQQITLGSAIAAGAADEWQYADLPSGLDGSLRYGFDVYDSADELVATGETFTALVAANVTQIEGSDATTYIEGRTLAAEDYGTLKPTVAGRTLDVTATGAAGIDWGNVENPTSEVELTQTAFASLVSLPEVTVGDFSALGKAAIRDALGMDSANLDTQLAALPAAVWAEDVTESVDLDSAAYKLGNVEYMAGQHTIALGSVNTAVGTLQSGFSTFSNKFGDPVDTTFSDDIANIKAVADLVLEDTGTTLPGQIANLDIGASSPAVLDDVAPARIARMVSTVGAGLINQGDALEMRVGDGTPNGLMFAADFTRDLKAQGAGKLSTIVSVELHEGEAGGITFDSATGTGVEHALAKFRCTGVTAGEYTVRITVTYAGSQGTRVGDIRFVVRD